MSDTRIPDPTVLGVLACDFGARPVGTPHFDQLAPSLRALRRDGAQLVAEYDPAAAEQLAALVAADRACSAGIGWEIESAATLRLTARPEQIELMERMLAPGARRET